MKYIQAKDGVFLRQIDTNGDVFWDINHNCPVSKLTPEEITFFEVYPLETSITPPYDVITQRLSETDPVIVNGVWTQKWAVIDLPSDVAVQNQVNFETDRISSLWQAAHDLEYNAISGSAIGLITIGVLNNKPKCLAVQNWIKSLWTAYYTLKASTSTSTDFSSVGPCPHTVPELMAEMYS